MPWAAGGAGPAVGWEPLGPGYGLPGGRVPYPNRPHRPHVDPAVGPQPAAPATTAKGGIAGKRKQAGRNGGYPLRDLSNWYAVALAQAAFI